MKTIETARLRLRPRTLDDLEPIVAMDTDPEVRRYLGGPLEPVAHRAEVRGNIVDGTMPDYLRWAIEWRDRPGFLGQCGVQPCYLPGTTELTWRLVRHAWRQGVASEAAAAMLAHVRTEMGAGAVVAFVHPDNAGSQGVARKLGLHPAGETHMHGSVSWFTDWARETVSSRAKRGIQGQRGHGSLASLGMTPFP